MIKKILTLIIVLQSAIISQNLDSIYNKLLALKPQKNIKELTAQSIKNKPIKCGFIIAAEVKQHFNEFSIEQQETITKILDRLTMHTSVISPSGFFRIHFDTTGIEIPHYFEWEKEEMNRTHSDTINMIKQSVDSLCVAFDSSYNYEVNILGYPPPPKDNKNGSDEKFDIYIENMGGVNYGLTTTDSSLGNGKFTSYIQMDNSFSQNESYYTYGIKAAKATAAHEFHHSIQMGNYLLNLEDRYYYEITSSAMEESVYDEVNDYYFFMPSFFNYTESSFLKHAGYDLAIWNIYLREKFGGKAPNQGDKIIKRSWELMAKPYSNRAIGAVAKALNEFGYSYKEVFREFSTWIYFTNLHAKQNKYFEEAKNYPKLKINHKYNLTELQQPLTLKYIEPISIRYIRFLNNSQGLPDTIVSIISDSDVITASTRPNNYNQVDYTLSNKSFYGATKINDFYYSKLSGISVGSLSEVNIINNELAQNYIEREETDYAYPQPFNYNSDLYSSIFIPTFSNIVGIVELNIYSCDMSLVYSNTYENNKKIISWNALDNNGNRLASGIYIYVTKSNNKIKKGKIVIFNK